MQPFHFSLLLLRQRVDERIAIERTRPQRNSALLESLERRRQMLMARLRRSLGQSLGRTLPAGG